MVVVTDLENRISSINGDIIIENVEQKKSNVVKIQERLSAVAVLFACALFSGALFINTTNGNGNGNGRKLTSSSSSFPSSPSSSTEDYINRVGSQGAGYWPAPPKSTSPSYYNSNVGPYEQCGGKNYDGPTSCVEAHQCYVWFDEWFSQCRPIQNYASPIEIEIYRQCGGKEYTGSTSCAAGLNCLVHNDWYSQCQPYEDSAEATWTQTGDLGDWTPGSQGFGCTLSYDGRTVVTNAWQNTNSAGYLAGATRIYNQNIGSQKWVQIGQEILGSGFLSLQGWPSISGDGKSIAVGEGCGNGGNDAQSGLIKVFTFLERINEWVQVGNNIAGEAVGNQLWWSALNFDGNILAAGALKADNSGTDSRNLRLFHFQQQTTGFN